MPEKSRQNGRDADIEHFTGRDLRTYADYLTLYFKDETLSEDGTPPKAMRNHECGVMREIVDTSVVFRFSVQGRENFFEYRRVGFAAKAS